MDRTMVRCALAALAVVAAMLVGCGEDPVLLLTVSAESRVESYDLTVRSRASQENVLQLKGEPVDSDNPLRDISEPGEALRLALKFERSGWYLVHVVGRSMNATQVATQIYHVEEVERHSVELVSIDHLDGDGDGFLTQEDCLELGTPSITCDVFDCDDEDRERNPLAVDMCDNGLDEDCDGEDRPCVDADGDGSPVGEDCDDNDPERFPGNPEAPNGCPSDEHPNGLSDPRCNDGVDQDCDGEDAQCVSDLDCDGSPDSEDCDDNDASVYPGAIEVCGNGIDEDCNDEVDDGCLSCDLDGDGYQRDYPATECPTSDYPVGMAIDCDDTDAGVFPGITDPCGGAEGGVLACAAYQLCDGKDNDCDGEFDEGCPEEECDADGDGFMPDSGGCNPPIGQEDCDDASALVYPGAPDLCGDGVAQNCNADQGCTGDVDGDGYTPPADCDETNSAVHPGAVERCNGIDDDCDGLIDEGNPDSLGNPIGNQYCNDSNYGPCNDPDGAGRCICSHVSPGTTPHPINRAFCAGEDLAALASPRCFFAPQPEPEECDDIDHDCDGELDSPDGVNLRELGEPCGPDLGRCVEGEVIGCDLTHVTDSPYNEHFICSSDFVAPMAEQCNGFDDNCDGVVPPGELDADSDGLMPCTGCGGLTLAAGLTGCDDCAANNPSQGTCGSATPDCCHGQCVNIQSNFSYCGGCDHACFYIGATDCVNGQCRCGTNPQCGAGLRCDTGTCVCDASSCPGCCQDNVCYDPPDGQHCGVGGVQCLYCGDLALCDPIWGNCIVWPGM